MSEYLTKVSETRDRDDDLPWTTVALFGHCDDPECLQVHLVLVDQDTHEEIAELLVPLDGIDAFTEGLRGTAARIRERKGQMSEYLKLLGEPDVKLLNSKLLIPSDGPNNHPDERMHWKIGDGRLRTPRAPGWQHVRLVGEVGKPQDEPWGT